MKNNISILFWGFYSYSFLMASTYFYFYWLPYGLNIFPLISISDVILISIAPLISTIPAALFYAYIISSSKKLNVKKEYHVFVNIFLVAMLFIISAIIVWTMRYISQHLAIFTMCIYALVMSLLINNKRIIEQLNSKLETNFTIYSYILITILPVMLFILPAYKGINDSHKLLASNTGYFLENSEHCKSSESEKFVYISTIGKRVIAFSTMDNSICITDERSFKLTPRRDSE